MIITRATSSASSAAGLERKWYGDDTYPTHFARYMHLMGYGQSNMVGTHGTPPITVTQPYGNVMFNPGVLSTYYVGGSYTSFTALIDQLLDTNKGETGIPAGANDLVVRLSDWAEYPDQGFGILGSSAARVGSDLSGLIKATGPGYPYWSDMVQAGYDIAAGLGESYLYLATLWSQGESDQDSDTDPTTYTAALDALIDDMTADVIAISGQTWLPPFLMAPPASHLYYYDSVASSPYPHISIAQQALWTTKANVFGGCPTYMFEYADDVHADAEGHRMRGLYFSRALANIMIARMSGQPVPPLCVEPKVAHWDGDMVNIQFHVPRPPLQFETSWVSAATNMGFDLWQSDRLTLSDTISSVTICGPDRVQVKFSATPSSGMVLSMGAGRATDTPTTGRLTGPRCNLSDSAGLDDFYVGEDDLVRRLHNYCHIAELVKP